MPENNADSSAGAGDDTVGRNDEGTAIPTSLQGWDSMEKPDSAADGNADAATAGFPVFDEDDDRGLSRSFRLSVIVGSVFVMVIIILCLVVILPRTEEKHASGDVIHLPLLHHTHNLFIFSAAAAASTDANVISAACRATRLPDVCRTSLSSATTDISSVPAAVDAAVGLAGHQVDSVRASSQSLLASSPRKNVNLSEAARECVYLLDRAAMFLKRYAAPLAQQAPAAVADGQAWMSASLTYENDCRSALGYVNTTKAVAALIPQVDYAINLTSNALSMLGAYRAHGADATAWEPPTRLTTFPAVPEEDGDDDIGDGDGSGLWWQTPAVTVDKDGSGHFSSVQAAVDAAPSWSRDLYVIYIKQGVYTEIVRVPTEKTNLAFIGDGIGRTVITGGRNAEMPGVTTYASAIVAVDGDGFIAVGVTFENTAGPQKHQAVALRVDSDQSAFYNCSFLGYQDTLYVHSLRQFYRDCQIEGSVDFIFGNAAAVFQNCRISVRPGLSGASSSMVTAVGRTDPAETTGVVLQGCHVDATPEFLAGFLKSPDKHRVYLGRPWKAFSRTIYLDCYLGNIVRPEGWLPWRDTFALDTLFYGEYNNSGPGATTSNRVSWSDQISHDVATLFTISPFIQGDRWLPSTHIPFNLSL